MKKSKLLMLSAFALGVLASCGENTNSSSNTLPSSEEVVSSSSDTIEADPLETALKAAQADDISLKGKMTHKYHYDNVMVSQRDVTRDSTITVSYEKNAWSIATLDSGVGNKTYYTSYFKDDDGSLAKEYINVDNSITLVPVLTYGTKELFDPKYQNPFKQLSVSDFVKEGDTYTISGEKSQMFVSHLIDETYGEGKVSFSIEDGVFTSIVGSNFIIDDYLYTSSDAFARETEVSFEVTFGTNPSISHLATLKDKGYTDLETALKAAENGKFHIKNGTAEGSMGFEAYFDGTNILATFNVGGTSAEDFDMYLTPGDDGNLKLYIYNGSTSTWVENSYEGEEMTLADEVTYAQLAPKMYEVSSNIFSKSSYSETYSTVDNATQYVGKYFVSELYEYLGLSTMECLRNTVSSFQLSNVTATGFNIAAKSTIEGSGFKVSTSAYFEVSEIGTCTLPYTITIGE